ncbi:tyrosine-type recombinase/integrase [Tepidibacter formicigenes]|uniref:tyrosine-type recombinase/integrase n=1 Tax=Tepidibacter formicigenes TaxID=227138 RepID=UPI001FA82AC3|nr:tyrosine-type recombinase/integrase [Tepidibacter formicigenes]
MDPIKSKREIQAVKNYLSGKNLRDCTLFIVGINSALRVSDILKLKWRDVFYETGEIKKEIRLIEKKTNKQKGFPINKSMQKSLLQYFECVNQPDNNEYIFKSRQGCNSPLSTKMAWKHGVPIETLMKILNHSSQSVTKRYIGVWPHSHQAKDFQ